MLRTKPIVYFYYRQPGHFIINYPRKKNDKESQMMSQSSTEGNIPQKHQRKGQRKKGNGNNITISTGS